MPDVNLEVLQGVDTLLVDHQALALHVEAALRDEPAPREVRHIPETQT